MNHLLINSASVTSRLFGCLLHSSSTKISILACILYAVSVLQTLHILVLFLYYIAYGEIYFSLDFKKYAVTTEKDTMEGFVILLIKYISLYVYRTLTLIVSWKYRNLVAQSMTEAKELLLTHGHLSTAYWKYWCQIVIYPVLFLVSIAIFAMSPMFVNSSTASIIFIESFIVWAQITPICMEWQFAALASTMETALIDINQRIENYSEAVGDQYRSNCHLGDDQFHPFFQYQEIARSLPIDIPRSLINFQLNKKSADQGTSLVGYDLYSNSAGGLDFQRLPERGAIRSQRDVGVLGVFKAIEEEKQPARNQFAAKSRTPLCLRHLLSLARLRLSDKISPPKTRSITIHPKDRRTDLPGTGEDNRKWRDISELTEQHSKVAKLAKDVNTVYKQLLGAMLQFTRIVCVLNLYVIVIDLVSIDDGKIDRGTRFNALPIALHLFRLFYACRKGQKVFIEHQQIRKNLLALSRVKLSPRISRDVELFLTQVEHSSIEFTAGPNTRVDLALFFSMLVSASAYLIILLQFAGLL